MSLLLVSFRRPPADGFHFSDLFVYEYLGEVIGPTVFARKMKEYASEGVKHFYFMALEKEVVSCIHLTLSYSILTFLVHLVYRCDKKRREGKISQPFL